jgi:hypothetical protein
MVPAALPHRRALRRTSGTWSSDAIASACRRVGLDFVNRVAQKDDRRAFVTWTTDYQHVTLAGQSVPYGSSPAEATDLRKAARDARSQVLAEFERLVRGGESFARECARSGLLAPTYNNLAVAPQRNECGWVAQDLPDISLAERVLALFAVDYLWLPAPYHEGLYVCRYCGAVSFDVDGRKRGFCPAHGMHLVGIKGRKTPPVGYSAARTPRRGTGS